MKSLALNMIVGSRYKELDNFLASVMKEPKLFDEIIIVRTNKSQEVIDVLKKWNISTEYYFEWVDNFGLARNFALNNTKSEYMFWGDDDDIVEPEQYEKLLKLELTDTPMVVMDYKYSPSLTIKRERIIKVQKDLWKGRIHECIPLQHGFVEFPIYITHNRQHASSSRNIGLLRLELNDEESARTLFYLGKELYDIGEFTEGIYYLNRYIKRTDVWVEDYIAALEMIATYHSENNNIEYSIYLIKEAIRIMPERRWSYYVVGQFLTRLDRYKEAKEWFLKCKELKSISFTERQDLGKILDFQLNDIAKRGF